MTQQGIETVVDFWEDNVCGEHFVNPDLNRQTPEFFEAYRKFRYEKEHHLNTLIDWKSARNKSVLEIGLGLGADSTRWAEHAGEFCGVDLTQTAVDSTKRHLEIRGRQGVVQQANAESLPFDDGRFDLVYSHGVLHHTPDTLKTLKEVYRVVKPGGKLILMFYAKNSFNYWVRIQGLMRLNLIWNVAKTKLGGGATEPWATHIGNIRERGWKYFGWSEWPHHCTDGPECEIAYIRSWREMETIISDAGFSIDRRRKAHLPIGLTPGVELALAKSLGFYQFIWCSKPE